MIDRIYRLLEQTGYTHPLHPPFTHALIGLVVGAFIFDVVGLIFKRSALEQTARHCFLLAYSFLFPTALLGYLDWQAHFAGAWIHPIKIKMSLTALFFLLSSLAIFWRWKLPGSKAGHILYSLCFLTLTGLGYYGGELAFGSRSPSDPGEYSIGAKVFSAECSGCHPQGGNAISPGLPLKGSAKLENRTAFSSFLRSPPVRADGSESAMPAFPAEELSDKEIEALYEYLVNDLESPRKR